MTEEIALQIVKSLEGIRFGLCCITGVIVGSAIWIGSACWFRR